MRNPLFFLFLFFLLLQSTDLTPQHTPMTVTTPAPLWILGYGSLLFKPPLHDTPLHAHLVRFDGHLATNGYVRRFWQASTDHRGTSTTPGRVVTLVPASLAELDAASDTDQIRCCVYVVPPEHADTARAYLDDREQDGYTCQEVLFAADINHADHSLLQGFPTDKSDRPLVPCTVYVGTPTNERFVGPESVQKTASVIATAVGDSGPNTEYLFNLHRAVPEDQYLSQLAEVTRITLQQQQQLQQQQH